MNVFYINLAAQTVRRHGVEESFAAAHVEGWQLNRIEAVTAAQAAARGLVGAVRDSEKACFLSHIAAVTAARDGHALICEDDVRFGQASFAAIDGALARLPEEGWDIIYTDLTIGNPSGMTDFFLLRRRLMAQGRFQMIDLTRTPFSGAMAYIVNRRSIDKLLRLMPQGRLMPAPYDLYLRRLIHDGKLRAFAIFPFITHQSDAGEQSQIQQADTAVSDAIWSAWRGLVWAERDMEAATRAVARIPASTEPEVMALERLLGPLWDDEGAEY